MARNNTESVIERYLVTRVKESGGRALKIILAGDTGSPDRWCLFPNGKIVFVECKYKTKGKLSPKQDLWINRIKNLGFPVYVIRFNHEVDEMLKKEGLISE